MAQPVPRRRAAGADNRLAQLPAGHAVRGETSGNVYAQNRKMVYMTEPEIDSLAKKVAEHLAVHQPNCQVFTGEEILWIKGFFDACKRSRMAALSATVKIIVVGILGLIVWAIVEKIRRGFQ